MKMIKVITRYKARTRVFVRRIYSVRISLNLVHPAETLKMRRTTHFYVMVTSMLMLLLKDVRSDNADDTVDICLSLKHYFHNIANSSFKQDIADYLYLDGNILLYREMLSPFMKDNVIDLATPLHDNKIKTHAGEDSDILIQALNGQSVCDKGIDHAPSMIKRDDSHSRRHSIRRIEPEANRRYSRVQDVRRTDNRRDTLTTRYLSDRKREIRNRREVRFRVDERRRIDVLERQSTTRRFDIESRNQRESRTLTRENRREGAQRHEQSRQQRYDKDRRSQRNSRSFERRNSYFSNLSLREMRTVERRNVENYRNDRRSIDVIRQSDMRRERGETRQENNNNRRSRNIRYRRDRRANHESLDMLIRHSPELKQSDQFRSRNSNRRVISEQREISNQKENREMNVLARQENNKFVNFGTRSDNRRVDNMRTSSNRRFRDGAQTSIDRERLVVTRVEGDRRVFSYRRDNRDVRRNGRNVDTRENRREIRTDNSREMIITSDVKGIGYNKEVSGDHLWNIDGMGISRAILVGFVGILGRKIWQKQA